MSQTAFEPEGVYAGIPYRVLENGQIEAIMAGGIVRFRSVEHLVAVVSSDNIARPSVDVSQQQKRSGKQESKSRGWGQFLLRGLGIVFLTFIFLFAYGLYLEQHKQPLSDRIAEQCKSEFGSQGEIAINDCRIRLMTKAILERNQNSLDRAYNRSR